MRDLLTSLSAGHTAEARMEHLSTDRPKTGRFVSPHYPFRPMNYRNHSFSKITFKNKADDTPELTLEYVAEAEDGTGKEARDTFDDVPHQDFRSAWDRLVSYWKRHIEDLIGEVDWELDRARVTTIRLEEMNGYITSARYWVTCYTVDDEAVTISTPETGVNDAEREALREVCEAALEYLKGARDQGDLFDEGTDEFPEHKRN